MDAKVDWIKQEGRWDETDISVFTKWYLGQLHRKDSPLHDGPPLSKADVMQIVKDASFDPPGAQLDTECTYTKNSFYIPPCMRKKVNGWLQVLNRAFMPAEEKEKKTSSGKTFTRK